MSDLTLQIEGMTCGHCLNAVRRALAEVEGTTIHTVQMGRAEVDADAPAEELIAAVERAGYAATVVAGRADA